MPTFTAIALDRLIEPGAAKPMAPVRSSPDSKLERRYSSTPHSMHDKGMDVPSSKLEKGVGIPPRPKLERGVSVPPRPNLEMGLSAPPKPKPGRGTSLPPPAKVDSGVPIPSNPKLDRRNGVSAKPTSVEDEKHRWTCISPALYATPASTPLPDSPSSFPPSPYIINHKRRGPRLMKSFSDDDVATCARASDEIKVDQNGNAAEKEVETVHKDDHSVSREVLSSTTDDNLKSSPIDLNGKYVNGAFNEKHPSTDHENGSAGKNGLLMAVGLDSLQDDEVDDFLDPLDSISVKSISESEVNVGADRAVSSTTPLAEFYDAWEELSSESGPQLPIPDIENELREIRLSLLMEIEKRKEAEENLNNVRNLWQRICEQLSLVGLILPDEPTTLPEGEQPGDPAADLCQQVYVARFVSNSIGRGIARAEVEMEMEAQIKLKDFEIARLWDRLHYYEAVNQEMSQRNQEVVDWWLETQENCTEISLLSSNMSNFVTQMMQVMASSKICVFCIDSARRLRQRRKRRSRWVWGSIAAAVTLGSAVLAYSYFQSGKGSSSSPSSTTHAPEKGSRISE